MERRILSACLAGRNKIYIAGPLQGALVDFGELGLLELRLRELL